MELRARFAIPSRYHGRDLVETASSGLERWFGEALAARGYRYPITEIAVETLVETLGNWIDNGSIVCFAEGFTRRKKRVMINRSR